MKSTRENRQLGEKPVPVPLCPPQISHGLTRDRTWASAIVVCLLVSPSSYYGPDFPIIALKFLSGVNLHQNMQVGPNLQSPLK
jgi:hypothetical protein